MNVKWLASAFVCSGLMYCGGGSGSGGSGVDANKTIGVVSDLEAEDLCEYLLGLQPSPPRTIVCDSTTFNIGIEPDERDAAIAECAAQLLALEECNATVGQAEDCAEANAAQLDGLTDDEFCDAFENQMFPEPPAACTPLQDPSCDEEV